MSSFFYNNEVPLLATMALQEALVSDGRFSEVGHRRIRTGVDGDTMPLANTLTLLMENTTFHVDLAMTSPTEAQLEVRRATDNERFVETWGTAHLPKSTVRQVVHSLREKCATLAIPKVRMTDYGAMLLIYPRRSAPDVRSVLLKDTLVAHDRCGGGMEGNKDTEHLRSLVCKRCCLRVLVPSALTTIGDLLDYFGKLFPEEPAPPR